jgi:hypothetical protein
VAKIVVPSEDFQFSSLSLDSADSLFLASISSLRIGSFGCLGWAVAWIARSPAAAHLDRLSVPGMSTVREIMSLIYISWVSLGFTLMSMINSFPMPTGMLPSIVLCGRTKFWVGEGSSVGSHESLCRIDVAKLQVGSENTSNSFGQENLPNVRQR